MTTKIHEDVHDLGPSCLDGRRYSDHLRTHLIINVILTHLSRTWRYSRLSSGRARRLCACALDSTGSTMFCGRAAQLQGSPLCRPVTAETCDDFELEISLKNFTMELNTQDPDRRLL
jgi:hypothetical protein